VPGTCVTVTLEGKRPLVAEVQSLVVASPQATPRRTVSGLDAGRVAMILAVLARRAKVAVACADVYAAPSVTAGCPGYNRPRKATVREEEHGFLEQPYGRWRR